jgi:hypothetical protein
MRKPTPDVFDSLAAVSKFSDIAEWAPAFYKRHQQAIDHAVGFVRMLGSWDPSVRLIVGFTLVPVGQTAEALRGWYESASQRLSERDIYMFDKTMTPALAAMLPVFRDPELPPALEECRWGIESAFGPDPDG